MNSPTASSSDTPSRTLMEVLRVTAYCRVWSHCPQGGCKGTRPRGVTGHKESVKSGFMPALQRGWGGRHRELARDGGINDDTAPNWRTKTGHRAAIIPDTTAFTPLRRTNTKWHAHCKA